MLEKGREGSSPLILSAQLGILWCAVFERDETGLVSCYVIGPVFHNEVNTSLLRDTVQRYHIDPAWRRSFQRIMQDIPVVSSILFFQFAVMLHFLVTGEKIRRSDLCFQSENLQTAPGSGGKGRKRSRHRVYQAEQALLQMIREGNLNYHTAMEKAGQLSSGVRITTRDPVNQAILSASNFTALCTRAAIEGGLTPDTAYTVGDSYLQSLTECRTIADVRTVNHTMYEDFIQRVHRQRLSEQYSRQVQTCRNYIEMHLDEELSLEQLAREVGYSEYHLSRKFKEETGTNIRDYIRFTRCERAKLYLSSSDLSIKEIAERLGFCAPSYFSRIFREVTGMLPQEYRKENYR